MFPDRCLCCGAKAETEYLPNPPGRAPGMPEPEQPLAFPYCEMCLSHLLDWQRHSGDTLVVANLAIWGVAIPLAARATSPFMVIGPLAGAAYALIAARRPRPQQSSQCSTKGTACRAIWYRRGTYAFSFTNQSVSEEFRRLNQSSLSPDTATA